MKSNKTLMIVALLAVLTVAVIYGLSRSRLEPGLSKGPSTASVSIPPGRVTLIDLGATECVPCKMMAPILEELKTAYAGKADILFIDVWKNPDEAKKFGVRAIPTQIFFDKNGKEAMRHIGFMDKKQIEEVLSKLGVS